MTAKTDGGVRTFDGGARALIGVPERVSEADVLRDAAVGAPDAMAGIPVDTIVGFLQAQRTVLWGASFNVVDNPEQAAMWFRDQMTAFFAHIVEDEA